MTQSPPPPATPPGWYVDPGDPTMLRWWDGRQWTDNWQLVPQPKKKSRAITPLLVVGGVLVGVLLFVGGCVALLAGSSTSDSERDRPTAARDRPATTSEDPRAAELEQRQRDQEIQRLTNRASYSPVTSREWQLVAKNPTAHKGELYVIYGRVTQADSAMGTTQIRVDTDGQQVGVYDFDINTIVDAGLASFKEVVEDDLVAMWVSVEGDETYTTTMGGSLTAPKVEVNIIEVYGSAG